MKAENNEKKTESPSAASLSGLIWSLSVSGSVYLGQRLAPDIEPQEPNLDLARHTIDTLQMLKDKTEGNRTGAETELLDSALYQLRMQFIETGKALKNKQPGDAPQPEDRPGSEAPETPAPPGAGKPADTPAPDAGKKPD